MKSWFSFLLPDNEYKEKKMLYFLAEGAIILLISIIAMMIYNQFFTVSITQTLLFLVVTFLVYIKVRYIFSDIEYTHITTKKAYKKELKVIYVGLFSFIIIFSSLHMLFGKILANYNEWLSFSIIVLSTALAIFLTNFISLKRLYNKNKDLLYIFPIDFFKHSADLEWSIVPSSKQFFYQSIPFIFFQLSTSHIPFLNQRLMLFNVFIHYSHTTRNHSLNRLLINANLTIKVLSAKHLWNDMICHTP